MNINTTEYSETEIQEAIQDVLQGHSDAFEIIYDSYYKMVSSIIRRIVKPSYSESEDIINEAFFLIFKGLRGFKGDSKFSTYAYRIVLNYAFKISKKKSIDRKNFVVFDDNEENAIEHIPSNENIDHDIVHRNSIEKAIGKLTKDLQIAVDLYYYERYSIKEISQICKTTETAIKNRLYQARTKIKSMLS